MARHAVIATATESRPAAARRRSRHAFGMAGAACLVLALLVGCAEEPLPQRRLTVDDCLRHVELDQIKDALQRCDAVVKAYPKEPQPLNERFLLHSLAGDDAAACRDIAQAVTLAQKVPQNKLDRLLRNDLQLRSASCRD
ncbi:MAG: hypothetical protein WAM11_08235 [Cyanobium sp.]